MKSSTTDKPLAQIDTPLLAVAVPQGAPLPASLAELDRAAGGALGRATGAGDYKGKRDETLLVYGNGKAQRILLVGAGKAGEITRTTLRRAAAVAAKRARVLGTKALAVAGPPGTASRSRSPPPTLGGRCGGGSDGGWPAAA